MDNTINVLYVFDDKYAPYAGISITSLLDNCLSLKSKEKSICVFCAGVNLSDDNREKIDKTVKNYGQTVVWIDTHTAWENIDRFETGSWNGSKATWLKVFALWEIPQQVKSIIYIDSDTIVTGDISSITSVVSESNNSPLCMAYDSLGNTRGKKLFGLNEYYNAGIILFNLDYWREQEFKRDFFAYIERHSGEYHDNEQGLINDYFRNRISLLPLKYNTQGFLALFEERNYLSVYKDFPFYSAEEIVSSKKTPVICHFFRIFGQYPWEGNNRHPYRKLFEIWKKKSLWSDTADLLSDKHLSIVFLIERILYALLPQRVYLHIFRIIVDSCIW